MNTSSYVAWLDHSERDRKRALDAVQALREQGTVDELGLGVVWEPIAELLFPGTSTIQTRARYFLIVPWVYLDIERRRTPAPNVQAAARNDELNLIAPLIRAEDSQGVIGRQAKRSLKRLPSEVYWGGLSTWGIRSFHGSREQYHRWLAHRPAAALRREFDDDAGSRSGWHPALPARPADFPSPGGLRLDNIEAAFLADRVQQRLPDSLLAWLLANARTTGELFPWEHPQYGEMPGQLRSALDHASAFSLAMHGAQLLYNLLLSEALEDRDEWAQDFRRRLDHWDEELGAAGGVLSAWDLSEFWRLGLSAGLRASGTTKAFVERWVALAVTKGKKVRVDPRARELISAREHRMKGSRARLTNSSALQQWSGASGTNRIDYRWSTVQTIANDIISGLHDSA